jgi:Domain of unknown function (DUF397)
MHINNWKKSTRCESNGCVYVGTSTNPDGTPRRVHVGDDNGDILTFTPAEWSMFLDAVKAGKYDLT